MLKSKRGVVVTWRGVLRAGVEGETLGDAELLFEFRVKDLATDG